MAKLSSITRAKAIVAILRLPLVFPLVRRQDISVRAIPVDGAGSDKADPPCQDRIPIPALCSFSFIV